MSADALPQIKLTHDDNLAIYTKGDTTLVLCTSLFALTPASASVKTPKLVIYADTIFIGGRIEGRGKELRLHCNRLQWGESTFLNFKGTDGDQIPGVAPQPRADGQPGGNITIHVHCLPLLSVDSKLKFWPVPFAADVTGGNAGKFHKEFHSTDWQDGRRGESGKVTLYYSNPLFRGVASILDVYALKEILPKRLRMMQSEIVSTVQPNCAIKDSLRKRVASLKDLITAVLNLHETLSRCVDLVKSQIYPGGGFEGDLKDISDFIQHLFSLKDYSLAFPEIRQPAEDLCQVFSAAGQTYGHGVEDMAAKLSGIIESFKTCKSSVESKLQQSEFFPDTPLSTLVDKIWDDVYKTHKQAAGEFKERVTPSEVAACSTVSYTNSGKGDLVVDVPLVHPDQCQMMLRAVDAVFFSGDTATAREGYQMLFERLRFVPHLLAHIRGDIGTGGKTDPWPLQLAFKHLESTQGLSLWTMDTLANVYSQVCGRLDQLSMDLDLFGLPANWAPRLSYDYHSQDAKVQIERLSRYEVSYWNFFDAYKAQMEAGLGLQEARAVNVYRSKQADDEMTRAMATITQKEIEIEKAAADIAAKREKLQEALQKVKKDLDGWGWPSIGTTIAAVASVVIIGAFVASNPAGWATAAMAVAAGSQQIGSLKDEMCDTIKDANGLSINKKYLINQLSSCDEDIGSLLKTAYTMQLDGSRSVDESDTQKIAVTEAQLQKFLQQFKDKLPEVQEDNLKKLLQEFVDASKARNQNILTYNNACISLYQQTKNKLLINKQTERIGFELLKQNQGLPSVVAYYQRLRKDSRVSILRAVKQSAFALRFWGLRATAKFDSPSLLSNVDELQAHLGVLTQEYELSISRFGTLSQSVWPRVISEAGILYRLSEDERDGLKIGVPDINGHNSYSVQIVGLNTAVTRDTTLSQSPFAGHSNVRISQVRAWLPGATVGGSSKELKVELVHEGRERITDPDDVGFSFEHPPIHLSFQYDWKRVKTAVDMKQEVATARQVLPSDWSSGNANARVQAAFGPFATWRMTVRESVNGVVNLEGVEEIYLEFCGSSFPFRG